MRYGFPVQNARGPLVLTVVRRSDVRDMAWLLGTLVTIVVLWLVMVTLSSMCGNF